MADPISLATFRDAALRSGLVSTTLWNQATEAVGKDADAIARYLIAHGQVTAYQAQQLHAGRGKLTLGPYLITGWIGQGGMGQVFKAVHQVMGRQCAVKVLPIEKSTAESRESFQREIRLQAGLDCPYLVRAFDAGHDGSVHYLVTEYVPGTDLRRLVRSQGPLSMNTAATIIRQAALGLQYAHEQGLIHRDVKPGNILVTPEGHAKVSDVGLAAWSMGLADDPRAGKIVGTADYLSPEQIRSPLTIGPPSDLYSLGCTLYYCVTGKVPYPGGDTRDKCRRHVEETPWHPRKFAADLAEDFVELIADMMEKLPERRIASAAEVADRLLAFCDGGVQPISGSLIPSPWTAAPPPAEVLPIEPSSTSQISHPSSLSPLSAPLPPPIPDSGDRETTGPDDRHRRRSVALPVAIAIAISGPIFLLIGAVIGFLVRGKL